MTTNPRSNRRHRERNALGALLAVLLAVCATAAEPSRARTERQAAWNEQDRAGESQVVVGRDGWLFFGPELRHLGVGPFWGESAPAVSRAPRPDAADPLPAIKAFHEALAERGVSLLLVPVPPKAAIYPDYLPAPLDPDNDMLAYLDFYEILRDKGIEVLDLTARFREHRDDSRGPLYCLQDTHWSGVGCVVAAEAIAEAVRPRLDPVGSDREIALKTEWRTISIAGDLARMLPAPPEAEETLAVRRVGVLEDGRIEPLAPDPQSPVLLLGDSHALVFQDGGDMHARGAGLADQLAYLLGRPVDRVAVRGSGATPARINLYRRVLREPEFWNCKAVVIWCFAVREFTESDGWRIVPVDNRPQTP